jgi:23S rRNA (cytosine1962-C5)-methyltransferase
MQFDLPQRAPNRLAVKVKPAAERKLRQQHPWVYDGSIKKQNKEGEAGDIAIIFDQKHNKLLAIGLYDPYSPIRIKVLSFGQGVKLEPAFWAERVDTAFAKRQPLLATDTNSYRLIYGENDNLPGLVADVYADVLVVKLYSLIWLPYLNDIFPELLRVSGSKTLVLRLSRNVASQKDQLGDLQDGQVLFGALSSPEVVFREHGVLFGANVIAGHKTGYFLDHRHNRKRVGELAKGKTVLDVFAYAGGFSVHALVGGAKAVTSLDISAQALKMATKNVALNRSDAHHETLAMDAFVGLQQLYQQGRRFDMVVIDPPSFAKSEKEQPGALEQYARLSVLGIQLVSKVGILVLASCSSRVSAEAFFTTVEKAMRSTKRPFKLMEKTGHDIDHPVGFPEGAYLKCGFYKID